MLHTDSSDANILRINYGDDMVIKVFKFVFSRSTKLQKNEHIVLLKKDDDLEIL